jgi:internalin A
VTIALGTGGQVAGGAGGAGSADSSGARTDAGKNGDEATTVAACPAITFADLALEKVVRANLSLPSGELTAASIATLTDLDASEAGITSLSGIECLTSLTQINIGYNPITDLRPLATMTWLVSLDMVSTSTGDISALANLTNLIGLTMGFHKTSIVGFEVTAKMPKLSHVEIYSGDLADISPLSNCPDMYFLQVSNNLISDISPIAGMKRLDLLRLYSNRITDISPLAKLSTVLTYLEFGNNRVTDISPLGQWAGSRNLSSIDISGNPMTDLSPLLSIPHTSSFSVDARETKIDCTAQASIVATLKQQQVYVDTDCP